MKRLMIIEDTQVIREELTFLLIKYGYEVIAPVDFENIINDIKYAKPDLILLDINLPVFDGFYICREIRKDTNIPIIIVTSRNSEIDELMSMNLGADDFVTKPYNTQVLLARIASLLRRSSGGKYQEILEHKVLKLNVTTGVMEFNNSTVDLTKNEIKILSCLIKNKGVIVSRDELMDYLWNSDMFVDENTLSVNIARLRKKLDSIGFKDAIETKRGIGYSLL